MSDFDNFDNIDLIPIKLKAIRSLLTGDDIYKVGVCGDLSIQNNGIENFPTDKEIDDAYKAEKAKTQYLRDRKYPTLEEQLDMQYWDEVNGTTKWKDAIAKIKTDSPKPTE